jgi:hypothetical protein
MRFGEAINAMEQGRRVTRTGWNGKAMWLGLCIHWSGNVQTDSESYRLLPFIYLRTAQADIVPWLASQTDMLANDWQVLA